MKRLKSAMGRKDEVLFLRGLPNDLKAQFKAWCARRQMSMTQVIVDYMKSKVNAVKQEKIEEEEDEDEEPVLTRKTLRIGGKR